MSKTDTDKEAQPKASSSAKPLPAKVHTAPYLVRVELIAALIFMVLLTVWSITIDAPLEEHANPTRTPNPSKAPWYFLGLQEMLVYFDPWIAGVVLPVLIIVGLSVIPYIDVNPKGSGYLTYKERNFAIPTFLFGFVILWVVLIIFGVFLRGPGWNFFWPWEYWDPHKVVALTNVDLPYALGSRSKTWDFVIGGLFVVGWYALGVGYYLWARRRSPTVQKMGLTRFGITAFLFLTMIALPVKMALRLAFNIKYVWVTPWFNI